MRSPFCVAGTRASAHPVTTARGATRTGTSARAHLASLVAHALMVSMDIPAHALLIAPVCTRSSSGAMFSRALSMVLLVAIYLYFLVRVHDVWYQ